AVLVLDNARHQRDSRIEQRTRALRWMADELPHQFRLRKPDVFDRVRREKSVLNVQERSFGLFGGTACDQSEVAGLLCISRKKGTPSTVGDAIYVVVSGMNIQ